MAAEPWWKARRREQEAHATDVSLRAWRAGLSADQNADEVARAFDNGVSADSFVRRKLEEKRIKEAEETARLEEQHRLESTCHYEDSEHPCWGQVHGRGYDGAGTYAAYVYACEGHSEMVNDVYLTENGGRVEIT